MGYDISWHPITVEQINKWYFDVLENSNLANKLKVRIPNDQLKYESQREEFEKFYLEKYKKVIESAKTMEGSFNQTHAYNIALVQGFFEEFFYTRGSAISFIMDDNFIDKYTTSWQKISPKKYLINFEQDSLDGNYSGGVYLSALQVKKLLQDYREDENIKAILNQEFSHGRIDIFLQALNFAQKRNLGLLEATEVVEPYPDINMGDPICYCNLFNCHPRGINLFQMTVAEQLNT